MKRIAVGFALLVVAPSAAQQAQAPPSEPAHKVFVLSGCLTSGGAAETDPFKLTGAVSVGQAPPERSQAGPDARDVYELLPTAGLIEQGIARPELQMHVGKKVEVTVRPVEVALGPASSSSAPATAAKAEQAPPQRYTVTKIRSLAGSCL